MSNSKLVDVTILSPNNSGKRKYPITKITIHHMAGNLTVEQCGKLFQNPEKKGSSNYGIGTDGRVGLYVDEANRAWTSSNADNDNRAITIEVANDTIGGNWHVSNKALAKTIDLCVDICQRNGIKKLNFTGNKNGNLTMHQYFANTACPGEYLKSKFPYIAEQVNERLTGENNMTTLKNGLQTITYQGATLKVFKGYNDYKNLYMLSAVGKDTSKAVQDITKFDHNNMIIVAMANCNYFEMSNKSEYGQHYGVEQSEGDGVHSVSLDLAPKNKSYEVFYQLKDGTCGRCTSDEYWYAKKDVLFACTPYSTIVFNSKACNYKSSAFGNKDSVKNSQTMYMRVGGAWCIVATETKVIPSVMQSFALACGATEAFVVDSGGSTQMYATSTGKDWAKQIYTGRAIPNVLVLAKVKDSTNTSTDQDKPDSSEETVSKTLYDEVVAERDAYKAKIDAIKKLIG